VPTLARNLSLPVSHPVCAGLTCLATITELRDVFLAALTTWPAAA